jgi:hypothetical protein
MKHYDILIVDDEQRYADMLAKRLGLRGLTCKVCYDGRTAIDIVAQEGFSDGYTGSAIARPVWHGGADPDQAVPARNRGHHPDRSRNGEGSGAVHGPGGAFFMNKPLDIDRLVAIMARIKEESS